MDKVELLAPAGTMEALIGAVNNGADAVYLSGKRFGARVYAGNFDDDALREAVMRAHIRGVKVYATVNTLIFDDEMDGVMSHIGTLHEAGVDAVIVQDLGLLTRIRVTYPDLEIHASTQMNIHTVEQARFLKGLGVARVVLARETPLETVKAIKDGTGIGVEVFVHGALCIAYSGQCLMSAMSGGRSGNRGECAQPCRLPYTLFEDGKSVSDASYLLSSKDLMTLDHVKELIQAGVDSFKIEGRMRSAAYVIQSVRSYREAIRKAYAGVPFDIDEDRRLLEAVFNRSFTRGHIMHESSSMITNTRRPNHQGIKVGKVMSSTGTKADIMLESSLSVGDGIRILNDVKDFGGTVSRILTEGQKVATAHQGLRVTLDVTSRMDVGADVMKTYDKTLVESLEEDVRSGFKTVPVDIDALVESGKPMVLSMRTSAWSVTVRSETDVSRAEGMPLDQGRVRELLSRLGNTDFHAGKVNVTLKGDPFCPVGKINALRREAVEKLSSLMARPNRKEASVGWPFRMLDMEKGNPSLVIRVMTEQQLDHVLAKGYGRVIVDHLIWRKGLPKGFIKALPTINDDQSCLEKAPVMVTGVGALHACSNDSLSLSDTTFNVTNIGSAAFLSSFGVGSVMLSLELSVSRIMAFSGLYRERYGMNVRLGVQVWGRTELMISKHCPVAAAKGTTNGCDLCRRHRYTLEGQNGSRYPLMTDGACNIRLFSAKPIDHSAHVSGFLDAGIDDFVIRFTDETPDEMERVIGRFEAVMSKHN